MLGNIFVPLLNKIDNDKSHALTLGGRVMADECLTTKLIHKPILSRCLEKWRVTINNQVPSVVLCRNHCVAFLKHVIGIHLSLYNQPTNCTEGSNTSNHTRCQLMGINITQITEMKLYTSPHFSLTGRICNHDTLCIPSPWSCRLICTAMGHHNCVYSHLVTRRVYKWISTSR